MGLPPGRLGVQTATEVPPGRRRSDWLLSAATVVAASAEALVREDLLWPAVAVGFGGVLAVALLIRRTRPLTAVLLGFGGFAVLDLASILLTGQPFGLYAGASVVVLVYALLRWGAARQAAIGSGVVLLEWGWATVTSSSGSSDAIGGLAVLLFAGALGAAVRYKHVIRTQQLRQARSQERETLARELHDTVAHHVSAIAVQAQAGRFLAGQGDLAGATDALGVVEREASRALTEMRTMVGALRDVDGGAAAVQRTRGVADIDELTAGPGAAGPLVAVTRHGDLGGLGASVQAALYRVAQESVTNARRHARGATRVDVEVSVEDATVRLEVVDDGERLTHAPPPGHGLTGMAERVTMLGGTLEAGPRDDGGWRVRAEIPRRGAT